MPILSRSVPALAAAIYLGAALSGSGSLQAAAASRYVNASNIAPGHVAWIRSGPGIGYAKVGYLRSVSRHILAMGCRRIARHNWCEVRFQGTRGWIQDRFLRAPHVMEG